MLDTKSCQTAGRWKVDKCARLVAQAAASCMLQNVFDHNKKANNSLIKTRHRDSACCLNKTSLPGFQLEQL
jgi:hypothetical protein